MQRFQILFWKGSGPIGAMIRWQSRGEYAHAAILDTYERQVYESREGKGVQVLSLDKVRNENPYSLCLEVGVPLDDGKVGRFLKKQVGKKYDWSSVFRFVSRRQASRKSAGVWFCSEYAFAAIQAGGVDLFRDTEPWEVDPAFLSKSPHLVTPKVTP
ncbi:MAG: hypothetical protein AAF571_10510 [Verrucomicrobiota bacterium]